MRTSIATVSISGSLREKLTAIARAGFDGYELFENDFITSMFAPEELRSRSADLGLSIELYQPFRDIEGTSSEVFDRSLERARHKFELMDRLGVTTLLVCSNVASATIDDDELAGLQLRRMAEVAAEHGIRLAYEALAWGRYVSTYEHAWEIVRGADHPALGLCLDSFHILSRESDLARIDEIPADKIMFCQLADAPRMHLDPLSWSRHHRLFPGEGDWDLPDFVQRLLRAGYDGPLSLEVFNDVFRQGEPTVTARDARRSLLLLEDAVARLTSLGVSDLDLQPLPDIEPPSDFGFLEITPGEDDLVVQSLQSLGFRKRGRHRRKHVQLWEQGGVRVVLNEEREGPTPRIAAIGLEFDDVGRAADRASALRTRRVARDQLEDEEPFSAISVPDGTEIYLAPARGRSAWVDEFGSEDATATGPRFLRVDHVALAQPWQRMDEAVLMFRTVLGLEVDAGQDLPSETGLVHSRALITQDRTVRLALNLTPHASSTRSDYPNHIALLTDDLLGTLDNFLGRGGALLQIPQNYYDDLEARFGLDRARTAELRARQALFDQDEHGEFLHAYTAPIGDLAFEIVERRSHYDGYGAANAPVRLAAMRSVSGTRVKG